MFCRLTVLGWIAGAALLQAEAVQADAGTFSRTLPADAHGTVEISNVAGRIEVSGWERPEVEVQASLGAGADRVDVTQEQGRTSIRVIVPNNSFRTVSTQLHVRVPRDSELDISSVSADVVSTDVQGALQLKTVSGGVHADLFQRDVEIKTVSGDIALRGHNQSTLLHISTISGNIRIEHAAGDLEATTVNGDLNVHLSPASRVRVRTTSGDFTFEGQLAAGANLDAESVSGELTVRAVPSPGYEFDVSSFSGDIRNCMGIQSQRVSRYGPGERLNGTRGSAGSGARVRLKTMNGDVELCDHS